ncbi:MAG: class I SAM-dependent methyltransferase [Candidatus Omnitrophica bacterium]|nr:class I SAM-dependent methyltransferase [Candidatus Omnitrophota bacterium]
MQPLANNLLAAEDLSKPEPVFPLELWVCEGCWLLQIGQVVPPTTLFFDYVYFSSFSDTMLRHAKTAAETFIQQFALGAASRVVEIASNDGYLLRNFVQRGIPCLGIEPAANVAKVAQTQGIETLVEFFGEAMARRLASENRRADLILGNNVFAHAPETNDFTSGLKTLLKPRGRIVLEFPYAADMIERTEFDTIYHEHVFYFHLTALIPLFERHGLAIFRIERLPIHGGSLRLFACHRGDYTVEPSVGDLLARKRKKGLRRLAIIGTSGANR